jgi:glutaredoxin 3
VSGRRLQSGARLTTLSACRFAAPPAAPAKERPLTEVEIYTTPFCPYCHRAKALLERKGVRYREVDVMMEPAKRDEMAGRAGGRRTVPQIFVDGRHLGDSDDLHELEAAGELDARLGLVN